MSGSQCSRGFAGARAHAWLAATILGTLALAVTPRAHAALEWTAKAFRGEAHPLQKTFTVAFAFKNGGAAPVQIRDVQTNCDCLEAGVDKTDYQPGEAGVVTATFTVGERYGIYERTVTVVTNDGSGPHRLAVRIEVPDPAKFTPRTLEWKVGSEASELATELVVAEGITLEFGEIIPSNKNFRARLETLERGRRYRLHVTPATTAEAANGALRVKGKSPDGDEVIVSTYANVR